ncbi:unnamed protein product, partial [Timema podura]|nr:unnamed protein product [Timema podura]
MENHLGKTSSSPERDLNLDLPILDNIFQHETSALANYATEAGSNFVIYDHLSTYCIIVAAVLAVANAGYLGSPAISYAAPAYASA